MLSLNEQLNTKRCVRLCVCSCSKQRTTCYESRYYYYDLNFKGPIIIRMTFCPSTQLYLCNGHLPLCNIKLTFALCWPWKWGTNIWVPACRAVTAVVFVLSGQGSMVNLMVGVDKVNKQWGVGACGFNKQPLCKMLAVLIKSMNSRLNRWTQARRELDKRPSHLFKFKLFLLRCSMLSPF